MGNILDSPLIKTIQCIILDRDGVINYDSDAYIKKPAEWKAIEGSLQAIAQLNQAGYRVAVATNQSGLARGYFTESDLQAIHSKMQAELAQVGGHIDAIFYCPHGPDDHCACRKPKPGLLLNIADYFNIDLKYAVLIGDSLRDIQAAHAVNCQGILVKTGKKTILPPEMEGKVPVFSNLEAVVKKIIKN